MQAMCPFVDHHLLVGRQLQHRDGLANLLSLVYRSAKERKTSLLIVEQCVEKKNMCLTCEKIALIKYCRTRLLNKKRECFLEIQRVSHRVSVSSPLTWPARKPVYAGSCPSSRCACRSSWSIVSTSLRQNGTTSRPTRFESGPFRVQQTPSTFRSLRLQTAGPRATTLFVPRSVEEFKPRRFARPPPGNDARLSAQTRQSSRDLPFELFLIKNGRGLRAKAVNKWLS